MLRDSDLTQSAHFYLTENKIQWSEVAHYFEIMNWRCLKLRGWDKYRMSIRAGMILAQGDEAQGRVYRYYYASSNTTIVPFTTITNRGRSAARFVTKLKNNAYEQNVWDVAAGEYDDSDTQFIAFVDIQIECRRIV